MPAKRSLVGGLAPRELFRRLTAGPSRATQACERDLTVMFTDIAGFTELAERLPPAAVAELLHDHLGTLAERIEGENGTVDKVLGDGLLAFWEHGQGVRDPAAPAILAALAIRSAVEKDNQARRRRGLEPIRLRIGLHAGRLMMASLGAAGRLGVSLFGDTVNVAQRLEDAARHVGGGHEVTIVASDAVVARSGPAFRFERLGELPIRGRREPVGAFTLAGNA
jgi:class 3 adenylate cyclase